MPFVPNNPRLDGRFITKGPQNPHQSMVRRMMATLQNQDAVQLGDTTGRRVTAAYLPPVQIFTRPANPNIPPDLAAMRIPTGRATTAGKGASRRIRP